MQYYSSILIKIKRFLFRRSIVLTFHVTCELFNNSCGVSLDDASVVMSGKVGPIKSANNANWVTPKDRSKSSAMRNQTIWCRFVLLCFYDFFFQQRDLCNITE